MGSALTNVLLLIGALIIGSGITYFGSGLVGCTDFICMDQQMQIITAIVLTLFSFLALYFMTKNRGGG